ncbi:MAG: iron-containing alcohol dehydrogenase [Kiritimatiellia bacterium]
MDPRDRARSLLQNFTGNRYRFGGGVLGDAGDLARELGRRALVFANEGGWQDGLADTVLASLRQAGVEPVGGRAFPGARPNSPREDVFHMEARILQARPDLIVALGGGSVIDATKAAEALASLGLDCPSLDALFGMGQVTRLAAKTGALRIPLLAIQTAASSAAHLTKYANITDPVKGQKKLIIDDSIVPARALFDYDTLRSAPGSLLIDGILDGLSHNLEVFLGCPEEKLAEISPVALTAIELLLHRGPAAYQKQDQEALEAVGLATDLGGMAIMLGGTNGPHLNSFSFVDVVTHGRACGLLNPYYVVLFAEFIAPRLRQVGAVLESAGLLPAPLAGKQGRALGLAVAEGLLAFNRRLGAPRALSELPGFGPAHIRRALEAALDPALESKLKNMPAPFRRDEVEPLMGGLLQAAYEGRPDKVPVFKKSP